MLTCAAGQNHPNPAKGAQGPRGWSTGCAKGKLEPGSASQERLGEGGQQGVPAAVSSHLTGGSREGRARLLAAKV